MRCRLSLAPAEAPPSVLLGPGAHLVGEFPQPIGAGMQIAALREYWRGNLLVFSLPAQR